MSLDYWVINGKIPAKKLKDAIRSGKLKGLKLIPQKGEFFAIQYDNKGLWNAEDFYKGNVTWFVEYAGGHGGDKAQSAMINQLEKMFQCDISGDENEYAAWMKKLTGKALPKDPNADCDEVIYSKEFPKGKCIGNRAVSMDNLLGFKKQAHTQKKKLGVESVSLVKSLWG